MPTTNAELSERSEVRHEDFGVTNSTADMAATQNLSLLSHFFKIKSIFLKNTIIIITLMKTGNTDMSVYIYMYTYETL